MDQQTVHIETYLVVNDDKGMLADKDVERDSEASIIAKQCCPTTNEGGAVADSDDAIRPNASTIALLAEAEKIYGPTAHNSNLDDDSDLEDGEELQESVSAYIEDQKRLGRRVK